MILRISIHRSQINHPQIYDVFYPHRSLHHRLLSVLMDKPIGSSPVRFGDLDECLPMQQHFKTRFPAANVNHIDEQVVTATFFSDNQAHNDGILGYTGTTMVQLYCGCTSQCIAFYPMSCEKNMHHTLTDFIREHGSPNSLFMESAKAQIGKAV